MTDRPRVPLLVKIAPDLADDDVLAVADLALELGLDGIVATNTTISRDGLTQRPGGGRGGRRRRAQRRAADRTARTRSCGCCASRVGPELTLIGVGGIGTVEDARAPAGRRRHAAPGLHRLRLRRPDLAGRVQRALARERRTLRRTR